MRHALVERERQSALERARLVQAEHERLYLFKVETLRQDSAKQRLKAALTAVSVGSAVLLGAALSVWLGVAKPNADRRIAELASQALQREQDNTQLRRRLDAQVIDQDRLMEQLRSGQVERSVLSARLDEAMKELERRHVRTAAAGPIKPAAAVDTTFARNCTNPDDPMCNLNRR
jgi:hypothetical protein